MSMDFIKNAKRRYWRDKVLYHGRASEAAQKQLRPLLESGGWPDEVVILTDAVERHERKLDNYRAKLRQTA